MINIKSNRGITIVSLVIVIIVLLILTGSILRGINVSNTTNSYNNLLADIKKLKDESLLYFNRYGEIPKTGRRITIDSVEYNEIDLSKLNSITLNFGKDYKKEETLVMSSDVYVIDSSLNIYYLKGIQYDGETYHFID